MRVLIADDEIKVCNLVKQLVDWESLGLELAGIVHDSESALNFISTYHPEIVITDIRMPEGNGIEMIRGVREKHLDTHFIIISGHREFEYASQAIRYGVEDYLLKPLKQKELEKALVKIIQKQNARIASEQERSHLVDLLSENKEKAKSQFLERLLKGDFLGAQLEDLALINDAYQSQFIPGDTQLLMCRVKVKKSTGKTENEVLVRKIRGILETELVPAFHEAITLEQGDRVFCLLNGPATDFIGLRRRLHHIVSISQSFQDIFGSLDIVIALSLPVKEMSQTLGCVPQVEKAALRRIFMPHEQIIVYSAGDEPSQDISAFLSPSLRGRLKRQIEVFDGVGINQTLQFLLQELEAKQVRSGWMVKQLMEHLSALVEGTCADFGREWDASILAECIQTLFEGHSLRTVWAALQAAFAKVLLAWQNEKQAKDSRPIRDAKRYINEHYGDQITLQTVSDAVGLNPTYFSGAFKRETGQNFVDYLTQIRMEAAKIHLMQTDLCISDIAEKVGYLDMKYFYKRFKQATGLSPKEYQKLYH